MEKKYIYICMIGIFTLLMSLFIFTLIGSHKTLDSTNPDTFITETYISQLENYCKQSSGFFTDKKEIPVTNHPMFDQIKSKLGRYIPVKLKYVVMEGDGNTGFFSVLYCIYQRLKRHNGYFYTRLFDDELLPKTEFARQVFCKEREAVKNILEKNISFNLLTRQEVIKLVVFLRLSAIHKIIQLKDQLIKNSKIDEKLYFRMLNSIIYDFSDKIDFLTMHGLIKILNVTIKIVDLNLDSEGHLTVLNENGSEPIYLINNLDNIYYPMFMELPEDESDAVSHI